MNTLKLKIRNNFAKQLSTRRNYFFNRITPTWNALPVKNVQARIRNMFQEGIDDRFKSNGRYILAH